jgi:hypothetical protein
MRDYLDSLIDRHLDAAPQIKPRLPSMFEPENFQGGLDVAATDNNTPEMEETVSGPSVRTKIAPSHVEPMDPPRVAHIATPKTPATVQAMQAKADPIPGWHPQTRPPESMVNEGQKPSVLQKDESRRRKNPPVPIVPARKEEAATGSYPVKTASSKELMGRAHHPNPRSTADGLTQGLLHPSATLIAPLIPALAGPERSNSKPEPVINVTIGRIEVRATASQQKQTSKPERRIPVMSLEEYLRHRSGGQDR